MENPNFVITREQIMDHVWGYGYYGLYSPFSSYYSPWGYRGFNSFGNNQQFDGWIYTHAVIAELDEKGNLLWD
mgnify:CR=1 FL=1